MSVSISHSSRSQPRLIRTEVIWARESEDTSDKCPINLEGSGRRKITRLAFLGLLVITGQHFISSKSHNGSITESNPLGVEGGNIGYPTITIDRSHARIDPMAAVALRHADLTLPRAFDRNLANVDEPLQDGDIPYFFHTPRSTGQTIKEILGNCVGLNTTNLTATIEGIYEVKKLGALEMRKFDVIFTQYLHAGATLFNQNHRGRMFTIIRHPIERAVSMFYYLPKAKHEPTYDPDLGHISIEMWSRSKRVEHNWMTRFLSNEIDGNLTLEHLDISKEVLRKKCIVGLFDEKTESWLRLERFFQWKFYTQKNRECLDRLLNWGWSNKNLHPAVEEGSVAWNLLYKQNELDMMLYEYAQLLFEEQRALFGEGGSLVKKKYVPPLPKDPAESNSKSPIV